jgi:hypothetical protein
MWPVLFTMDPPVQAQVAHDIQNVHFSSRLQLLAADASSDEAARPANPCTGYSQGEDGAGDQGIGEAGE